MSGTSTAGNPLGAGSLATLMATSLPKASDTQLKNPYEAVALAVHAGMIAVGFRLIGLGEDHRIEASAEAEEALPAAWNASSSYAFRYAHTQSSMEYLVKVSRLGGKAVVYALALGDDKTTNFELTVKDYISESSLPVTTTNDTSKEALARSLQDVFISAGRLADLGALLKLSIIQKLAPGLQKEGYEDTSSAQGSRAGASRGTPQQGEPRQPPENDPGPERPRPHPFHDPLAVPRPGGSLPEPIPGFDDEYDVYRRPGGGGGLRDGRPSVGIGHDDLYPQGLGPNDPFRPHIGGGGLPRPGGMGGGMHPTFDDPLFGGGGGGQGRYDPMAPPGSRFDPIGPGGAPRDGRGGRGGFPGGGFGGGGFGGGAPHNPFNSFGDGDFI